MRGFLYVAIAFWEFEAGYHLIGVFDTREAAQSACDNHRYPGGGLRGDSRVIEQAHLNEERPYNPED